MVADDQGRECEGGVNASAAGRAGEAQPAFCATHANGGLRLRLTRPTIYCEVAGAALLSWVTTRSPFLAASAVPASSNRA